MSFLKEVIIIPLINNLFTLYNHNTKLWRHTCVLYNASSLTPLCVYMYCVTVIHMYMFGVKRIV